MTGAEPDRGLLGILACLSLLLLAAGGGFGVSLTASTVVFNYSSLTLDGAVNANGSDVLIRLPLIYGGSGETNISLATPTAWTNGFNWSVNESGTLKNVSANGLLNWSANLSQGSALMTFLVPAPLLMRLTEDVNATHYVTNLTVSANNSFTNVSVNVSVNSSFAFWWLYWQNGSAWQDRYWDFNLSVSGGYASFRNLQTSTQNLSLMGAMSCAEQWTCTAWNLVTCGNRTCTEVTHCGTTNDKPAEALACQAPSGGGGGGGPIKTKKESFTIEPLLIKQVLFVGEQVFTELVLRNTGETDLDLTVQQQGLGAVLPTLGRNITITLDPGQRDALTLQFDAGSAQPGVYTGRIVVWGTGLKESVDVIVEVQSRPLLFDIDIEVPAVYKYAKAGDEIEVVATLLNLGGPGRQDVTVTYALRDLGGNLLLEETETLAVETRATTRRRLQLPDDLGPGSYVVVAEVRYGSTVGTSSDVIQVEEEVETQPTTIIQRIEPELGKYMTVGLAVLLLSLVGFELVFHGFRDFREHQRKFRRVLSLVKEMEKFLTHDKLQEAEICYSELSRLYQELPDWARRRAYRDSLAVEKLLAHKKGQSDAQRKKFEAIEEYTRKLLEKRLRK